jgi:hypothetical protein
MTVYVGDAGFIASVIIGAAMDRGRRVDRAARGGIAVVIIDAPVLRRGNGKACAREGCRCGGPAAAMTSAARS